MIDPGKTVEVLEAADRLIGSMGPGLTFVLSVLGSNVLTQIMKAPLAHKIPEPWFSLVIRVLALTFAVLLMCNLSDAITWRSALLLAPASVMFYHASLSLIRRFWPWLELHPMVGSVNATKE